MFQSLVNVILPVFLVIGAGYTASRSGHFKQDYVDGLMKFAQNFAIPCLLFRAISNLDIDTGFDAGLLISYYTAALICFTLGIFGARLIFKRDWEDCIVIGFCCLFSNSLLLGLPITERAYGVDNLTGNYAIIAFHSPFCYFLGITTMEVVRNRGGGGVKTVMSVFAAMFKNVLILAIGLGFIVNLTGLQIPSAVDEALSLLIRAALPAALFALGGLLLKYRPEGDMRVISFVCLTSLMVHPALVWTFGTAQNVPVDLFRSGVITASVAPGINAYIFANMYGRAKRVAASSVLIATALSLVSAWFWLNMLG
ncbi:AEC family transporter [Parasedimentitalea marina]|uniref:AEC family transporter n=1 Tax=Parasedimentitalea marina TaxID=2483033 RepID=A0A3T0MZV0_9RHOB|nr:AEC family transporter [Parasedimentitalea marina]AZV77296.1 AEC family transporter [Parasedimentitalea marina]